MINIVPRQRILTELMRDTLHLLDQSWLRVLGEEIDLKLGHVFGLRAHNERDSAARPDGRALCCSSL